MRLKTGRLRESSRGNRLSVRRREGDDYVRIVGKPRPGGVTGCECDRVFGEEWSHGDGDARGLEFLYTSSYVER